MYFILLKKGAKESSKNMKKGITKQTAKMYYEYIGGGSFRDLDKSLYEHTRDMLQNNLFKAIFVKV